MVLCKVSEIGTTMKQSDHKDFAIAKAKGKANDSYPWKGKCVVLKKKH